MHKPHGLPVAANTPVRALDNLDVFAIRDAELPATHGHLQLAVITLTVAVLAWACVGESDVVSTASGKIIPDGHIKVIQSPESAIVKAIHVSEGALVHKGDLLLELDPALNATDLRTLTAKKTMLSLEIARLQGELHDAAPRYDPSLDDQAALRMQEKLRLSRSSGFRSQIDQIAIDMENARNNDAATRQVIEKMEESVLNASQQVERFKPYVGQAIPMVTYITARDNLLAKEKDLLVQKAKLLASRNELRSLAAKLRQLKNDQQSKLVTELFEKEREYSALLGDMSKNGRSISLKEVRAPIDGQVQNVSVATVGAVLGPAQNLLSIVPNDKPLIVDGYLENADIAYVTVGQEVVIKVDAYPYMQYGGIVGRLSWISPDSENRAAGAQDKAGQSGNAVYRIRVVTDGRRVHLPEKYALKTGMTVHVDIKTDQRKFIQIFMQPLFKYLGDSVRQR